MLPRTLALTLVAAFIAGCSAPEREPVASASPAQPTSVEASAEPDAAPEEIRVLALHLDGSTGTQAFVCAAPAPTCAHHAIVASESDLLFEGLDGQILGGTLSLTWTANGPATQELAFGAMIMGGEGEACAPIDLGSQRGPSPMTIELAAPGRAFCPGEVLHAWASNGIYVGDGPAYAQLDVDQPFQLAGNVTLGA